MRVKLLLLGIAYFGSIWDKSDATNKCYRAKICIHDGKEKCGQNTKGEVRRFLDTCDMKEYNCLKNANFEKTYSENCRNLPPIDEKLSVNDDSGNKNEAIVNESKDGDNEKAANKASSVVTAVKGSKENREDQASQEVGFGEASKGDEADAGSNENAFDEASKADNVDRASKEEKFDEAYGENRDISKEYGTNKTSVEGRTSGENKVGQLDDADDVNEAVEPRQINAVDGTSKEDEVDKDNIVNESKSSDGDKGVVQTNKVDKADGSSEEDKEKGADQVNQKKLYGYHTENEEELDETD